MSVCSLGCATFTRKIISYNVGMYAYIRAGKPNKIRYFGTSALPTVLSGTEIQSLAYRAYGTIYLT